MHNYFTATVLGASAEQYVAVFGTATLPVVSAEPERKYDTASGALVGVFVIDVAALTLPQRDGLVRHWLQKLPWLDRTMVEDIINAAKLAIPAADCVVSVWQPGWVD